MVASRAACSTAMPSGTVAAEPAAGRVLAIFAGFEASDQRGTAYNGVQGMMYAGLGAYVAVLYYMVGRLYANALSSRFLLTSALRTASAVVIGWVFGIVGVATGLLQNAGGVVLGGAFSRLGPTHSELLLDGYNTLKFDVMIVEGQTVTYKGKMQQR